MPDDQKPEDVEARGLEELDLLDRRARVFHLRFDLGLGLAQIAESCKCSIGTVFNDVKWLREDMPKAIDASVYENYVETLRFKLEKLAQQFHREAVRTGIKASDRIRALAEARQTELALENLLRNSGRIRTEPLKVKVDAEHQIPDELIRIADRFFEGKVGRLGKRSSVGGPVQEDQELGD